MIECRETFFEFFVIGGGERFHGGVHGELGKSQIDGRHADLRKADTAERAPALHIRTVIKVLILHARILEEFFDRGGS